MYKRKIFLTTAVFILSLFMVRAQTPGGVTNPNYTWQVWLTPDSYDYPTGVWTNKITTPGTVGNFSAPVNRPAKLTTGYNFQPSIEFTKSSNADASKRLTTSANVAIASGDNVTTIFVYKRANNTNIDYLFSFNNGDANGDLVFYTNNSDELRLYWPGTNRGTVLTASEGIIAVDNANNATNQAFGYINGAAGAGITTSAAAFNSPWTLGANGSTGSYGFEGAIQEVIILKASGANNHIEAADLQRINSYLAIKYGFTLDNTNNYVNSDGYAVWNRTTNNGYNNNIFGIGRDNVSGLNQVQSRSQSSNILTVYKGTFGTNNNNASNELTDKSFLMLGSNGQSGNTGYVYPANTAFANGSTTNKINYYATGVYKAQITTAGAGGGSQTVNISVTSTYARYILVSPDATFPPASTRIYPITAMTATNVLINDGEYVTTAGFQPTPGGLKSVNFGLWLTPDSYSNGVWTNLISGAIGDFKQQTSWTAKAPPTVVTGTNFQPAMQFRASSAGIALNRLQSANGINLTTNDAFTFLIVYKATNARFPYQNLLQYQGSTTGAASYNGTAYSVSYITNNSPVLSTGWPTTARTLGTVPFGATAVVTVDNSNGQATTNGIRHYLNGTQIATAASASGAVNNQIVLGAAWYDLTGNGERGVNADIQEVIMLKRPKATYPFLADINSGNDLMKIQTYLALKYGITLNSNYMATDGTVVWDTTANKGYNKFILGVGRDDETGLYQRQSVSSAYNGTTIYLDNKLQTLNSQNAATLNDKEYLILGSNGLTTISPVYIADGTAYANGNINATTGLNYQSNTIYKAQLTNLSAMTINIKLRMDFLYVLVSKSESFDPSQTNIYPINSNKIAAIDIDSEYKYIRFVGYEAGPGGVNIGLKLWLHADDESSLNITSLPLTDPTLGNGNYPFPVPEDGAPAIQSWADQLRGQTYSWPATVNPATPGNWRTPVYEPDHLMMNFKPSVRFWGNGTYGSYLSNPNGIMPAGGSYPWNPNGHTAYFVIAGAFSPNNNWIYQMGFGTNFTSVPSPGYGVQLITAAPNSGNMVGRIRSVGQGGGDSGTLTNDPANSLFNLGATAINGYYQLPPRTTAPNLNRSTVFFRFNGKSDTTATNNPFNFGFNMSQPSYLGASYAFSRTVQGVISEAIIFDHALSAAEHQQVESYLAIKYGVTLRPSNTATNRFDYTLSNGTVFWPGNVAPSDPVLGKYATFYNNIAAVIRDDAAKLDNTQSHSTDAGSLLHMGVAGTRLGSNYDVGELPNDLEVVVWGSNNAEGVTTVATTPCADFQTIFNKQWLVHKQTQDDRPITMLVGAEDNSQNNLGSAVSIGVSDMYTALGASNDVSMIVADSPDKLTPGNAAYGDFLAVVPMTYINGEQQCNYTFKDSIVYITFGYKPNSKGCYGAQFDGSKIYNWNEQWPRTNYNITSAGIRTIAKNAVDLGDSVTVQTQVTYDNAVRADSYYPRFASSPRNALEIQRRGGAAGVSKVTTTITFSTPVVPTFFISGLDSRSSQMDQVTIIGSCPGGSATPTLMYASGDASKSTYTIQGNMAKVTKTRTASATDKNGTLNVTFQRGVTTLTIEWIVNSRRAPGTLPQNIFISPITITSVLPPPVVNEDGLSFTKQVEEKYITTCDPVNYTFRIGNTNGEPKYMSFSDVLPDKMKWKAESLSFDAVNAFNSSIKFNNYGGTNTLTIDSLLVPCASEIIFKVSAAMDEDASTDAYANRATITYEHIVNNVPELHTLGSQDAATLDSLTVFNAAWAERQDTVKLAATPSPATYAENKVITVTLKVNNPNTEDITDMFLDLTWDAGFKYVEGSWNNAAGSTLVTDASDSTVMLIAGASDGSAGFTLSNGETIFTFKLLAPDKFNLVYDEDEVTGEPTTQKAPLNVSYNFGTEMDDPCIVESMNELTGILTVQYKKGKDFIIVNKHITTQIIE